MKAPSGASVAKGLFLALSVLSIGEALAQVQGTVDVTVAYSLPTKNTDGTDIPATGLNSLAKARVYLSNSAIPADVSGLTPAFEGPVNTSSVVPGFSTTLGATIHTRVVVCNVAGVCGAPTNEGTGTVTAKTPGAAVFNSLTISVR